MSGFFRRLLAFVLGVLVAYVGVAFWAYQNVRPMKIADTGITISEEIDDYSLEQFAELVVSATKNPTDFSFDRLEKEYGVDLKALLEKMGVDVSDANEEDWNAFKNISVLNIVNGIDPFLDNIKLRALYPLLPSITKLSLDEILSPEAQVQLGDYSVYELMQSDAATKEIGLMTALKGLTVGSLVPSLFDATYDEANHRYIYTVKEDSPAQILNLIANVQLKGVVDIIGGADVMEEIMEGGLKPIADMPIAEIIGYVLDIAGEEVKNVASDYVRVLGDLTFSDMFKREGDGYVFTTDNIATELEFGYLFGLTKGDDGVWYKDKEMTQPADGVFGMLADFKLVDLFDANGDPVAIVESVLGEMSIKTIYETIYEEDDIPFFANVLKNMTVNDLLRGGVENVFNNVVENVDYYLSNLSIGDLIGDLLPENVSAVIDGNDLLKGLMKLRIGDFIADEYTVDTFVDAFNHAIGDVSIGGALGFEKTDGVWNVDFELLGVLFNIEFGDIVDAIRSDDLTSATQALIGSITFGDVYNPIFSFTREDETGAYHNGDRYLTKGFGEFLDLEIWRVVATFDPNNEYDITQDIFKLTAGDVIYSLLETIGVEQDVLTYSDEKVTTALGIQPADDVIRFILNTPVQDYIDHYDDLEWWKEQLENSLDSLTFGYIYNLALGTERDESGAYHKGDRYLTETFGKVLDLKVWKLVQTFDPESDYDITVDLFKLTAGDILYSLIQTFELDQEVFAYSEGAVVTDLGVKPADDLIKFVINTPIQEYVDHYDDLEWWKEQLKNSLDSLTFGYIYNLALGTERDENGAYHKGDRYLTETFGKILDLKVWSIVETLEEDNEYNILTDLFKLTAGDVAYSVMQTLEVDQDWLVYEDGKVYVDMEPDVIADVTKVFMNIPVQEYVDNYDNLEWWKEKAQGSLDRLTFGYIYNIVFGTETDENGAYHKGDRYLTETFGKVLDLKVWKLVQTFDPESDYDITVDLFKLTAGDVAYSVMQTLEVDQDWFVYEDGKVYVDMQPDVIADVTKVFMNIPVQEYVDNYDNLEWWMEKLDESLENVTYGYIYNLVFGTERDENGAYHKGDRY
ncbi:MAG: hypothetical protein IJ811_03370, partial [Clostridia bacterium]|nr:hypothetical protein [Clostridia bacterium]